jgi:hypothetical protein
MTDFERVARHIMARNEKTIDQLVHRNTELWQMILTDRTGEGGCPLCHMNANYTGIDRLIYHDNEHRWPEYVTSA